MFWDGMVDKTCDRLIAYICIHHSRVQWSSFLNMCWNFFPSKQTCGKQECKTRSKHLQIKWEGSNPCKNFKAHDHDLWKNSVKSSYTSTTIITPSSNGFLLGLGVGCLMLGNGHSLLGFANYISFARPLNWWLTYASVWNEIISNLTWTFCSLLLG